MTGATEADRPSADEVLHQDLNGNDRKAKGGFSRRASRRSRYDEKTLSYERKRRKLNVARKLRRWKRAKSASPMRSVVVPHQHRQMCRRCSKRMQWNSLSLRQNKT